MVGCDGPAPLLPHSEPLAWERRPASALPPLIAGRLRARPPSAPWAAASRCMVHMCAEQEDVLITYMLISEHFCYMLRNFTIQHNIIRNVCKMFLFLVRYEYKHSVLNI